MAPRYTVWHRNCTPPPNLGFFRFSLCSWSLGSYCPFPPTSFNIWRQAERVGAFGSDSYHLQFQNKPLTKKDIHHIPQGSSPPPAAEAYGGVTSLNPHVLWKVPLLTPPKAKTGQWCSASFRKRLNGFTVAGTSQSWEAEPRPQRSTEFVWLSNTSYMNWNAQRLCSTPNKSCFIYCLTEPWIWMNAWQGHSSWV